MNQSDFDDTIQNIQRLSTEAHQAPTTPEARRSAAAFVGRVGEALTDAGGPPWRVPLVEAGGDGAVVLLWQDRQRALSLVAGPEGAVRWFYEPGAPLGYLNLADASDLLTQRASTPEDFAARVWPAWVRGDDPS